MKKILKIAEIYISLNFDNKKLANLIDNLYPNYLVENTNKVDINIFLNYKNDWIQDITQISLKTNLQEDLVFFKFIKLSGTYNFIKKEGYFDIEDSAIAFYSLFRMLFSYSIAFFDGFYLHASSVFNENYGIIATGVSGAGKSTFALTLSKQNFKIIHDDLVLVRRLNGIFKIFSLPFIEDPRFKFEVNKNIPLTHLFFLGKSKSNYIENMSKKEIYKTLMRMILSFTDLPPIFYDKYFSLIEKLVENIHISRLYYNPQSLKIKDFL